MLLEGKGAQAGYRLVSLDRELRRLTWFSRRPIPFLLLISFALIRYCREKDTGAEFVA